MSDGRVFICAGCNYSAPRTWDPAPCPHCYRRWNIRYGRVSADRRPTVDDGERVSVADVVDDGEEEARIVLGRDLAPIDRVLGGGLVPGSVILLTGPPGIGKSTIALALLRRIAETLPVVYFAGEESVKQVAARARRLGAFPPRCELVHERELDEMIAHIDDAGAKVAVVDSVQMIACVSPTTGDALEPGGAMAVKIAVEELAKHAQDEEVVIILIGRVTRDGTNAGPRGGLDHAVDVVLNLDGDPNETARVLTAEKNRHGATARAAAHFDMGATGLIPVEEPQQQGVRMKQ